MDDSSAPSAITPPADFDASRRFVRLTQRRSNGFVEFDFAIGEPDVFVEMVLTEPAYREFCSVQRAIELSGSVSTVPDPASAEWQWRMSDATRTRFR